MLDALQRMGTSSNWASNLVQRLKGEPYYQLRAQSQNGVSFRVGAELFGVGVLRVVLCPVPEMGASGCLALD